MLSDNKIWLGTSQDGPVYMDPNMANRHGLISGATGTGKTVTLQVLAEAFSELGVPVFLSDIKGDLAGLSKPAEISDAIKDRLDKCRVEQFSARSFPVTFWDVFGESGHPVRATVSQMGPLLLGRMLNLNDTQTGVLHLVFRIADDSGMLLIDLKDLRAMLSYVGEHSAEYTIRYGNISKPSIGAIQRAIAILEDQGGNSFFAEPALQIGDWFKKSDSGQGMINILSADKLFLRPDLYASFMLWMLGEIYGYLPERGDDGLPSMVFFFDEAHLLFNDCPKTLMDQIELTIRLIRSKGVGVFFITQNPADVPGKILSQLGARVQHALRAFTPQETRIVKSVAETFRPNPSFDMEQSILSLGTGEALLSFLDSDGAPSITQKALILPPQSAIGTISQNLRSTIIETSEVYGKYDTTFDRESAYEVLSAKFMAQGVASTSVVRTTEQGYETEDAASIQEPPQYVQQTFKVFDPATGSYTAQGAQSPAKSEAPYQNQTVYTTQPQTDISPASPKQVYKAESDYPKQPKKQPKEKPAKKTKSMGEKMLDTFVTSTARGAGYNVGRTVSRGILGVFGIK
ncbi:MAG: helicase HerA-like domain-containing protein [Christensenellales bacterium]